MKTFSKYIAVGFGILTCLINLNSQSSASKQHFDSVFSPQPKVSKKYFDNSSSGYFNNRKSSVFLDIFALLNKQVNIGYSRQLNNRFLVFLMAGYNREYDCLSNFLHNHFSSPFLDINKFYNAFNSANFDMNPIYNYTSLNGKWVSRKNLAGKVFGTEIAYFFNGKVFNGSAIKLCYKYKDARSQFLDQVRYTIKNKPKALI
jgi:hypothetical protein